MANYISDRSCTTSGYIRAMINSMENGLVRMRYYEETDDIRFLHETNDWINVINIYMKEITNAQTGEVEDGTYCS